MKTIIIGGGPAGYMGAIRASQLGMSVTLIEKDELGGTCLNRGCVPTKALLQAASVYNAVTKEAAEWGIETGVASVDTAKLYDKKINIVEQLRKGVKFLMDSNKIEVISGTAKVLPNMQVLIKESGVTIDADKILVCTGSVAARLPIPGIEYALSSDDVLSAPVEAKKIAIIGGGVIGVELALFFARMGCEVTIYEYMSALVAMMDTDISKQLLMQVKRFGVKVQLQAAVKEIRKSESGFEVEALIKEKPGTACFDKVIACTGRKPFLGDVFAEGVTPNENIRLAGDAAGGIQLAHFASAQAVNIVEEWAGRKPQYNMSVVPQCIYTAPEAASVGLREQDCKEPVKIGMYRINGNAKSLILGENSGFVKTIFSEATGRLLGAHIVAPHATDMIGELAVAVANGLTQPQIASVIHPHPTVCESIGESVNCIKCQLSNVN